MRVLVIEDHPLYRRTLCEFLATLPGVETCGFAVDGLGGVELAERLQPDTVIVDLQVAKLGGFEICEVLRKRDPNLITIVACEDAVRYHQQRCPSSVSHLIAKDDVFERLPDLLSS